MIDFFLLVSLVGGLFCSIPFIYVIFSNKLKNFNPNNDELHNTKFI